MPAVHGFDPRRDVFARAAALLQLLTRNQTSVEADNRSAWAATWTFLGINGIELAAGFDMQQAERLVLDVATGGEQSVNAIVTALQTFAAH
jgi:death-on-curing protein